MLKFDALFYGIAVASSLQLEVPHQRDLATFSFSLSHDALFAMNIGVDGNPIPLATAPAEQHLATIKQVYGDKTAANIMREIALMVNSSTYQSSTWKVQIDRGAAVLEIFVLTAKVHPARIDFSGGTITLDQPIPPVFSTEQKCARTGDRRYGVVGPRAMECHTIRVQRGLNDEEIQKIKNHLIHHATGAEGVLLGHVSRNLLAM